MLTQTKRTLLVTVVDMEAVKRQARIHQLVPVKDGVLAKLVGTNYNVFRPYGETVWYDNVTSSTRFNLETAGLTADEMTAVMNEKSATNPVKFLGLPRHSFTGMLPSGKAL